LRVCVCVCVCVCVMAGRAGDHGLLQKGYDVTGQHRS
jgi:hypothetical protein